METKYDRGKILYLVNGTSFAKCIVDEIIVHYIQDGSIVVKYLVRPYGQKDYIPFKESELVETIEEAQMKVIASLEENYIKSLDNVRRMTNKMFDDAEIEYQKTLKGDK